jgi:hypothetical protein
MRGVQQQPYRAGQARQAGESLAAILRGATATGGNPQDQTRQLAAGAGKAQTGQTAAGSTGPAAAAPVQGPTLSDALQPPGMPEVPAYLAQLLAARH